MSHINLWSPWRIDYILSPKENSCIFCKKPTEKNDAENLILHRGDFSFLILNKFPYNSGHLMAVPYKHTCNFENLTKEELSEIDSLIKIAIRLLKKNMSPNGFNIGLNIGKAAGAGIDEHLHYHIVPRWEGDTNFMPVFANTRVVPQSIQQVYEIFKKDLRRMSLTKK